MSKYRVLDKHDNMIGSHLSVTVHTSGALEWRDEQGVVRGIYAPGTWSHVFWEEEE